MKKQVSRRKFLGTVGAATAAFTIVPRNVLGGKGYQQPSDKLNVAGIGIGNQGGGDVRNVCDPEVTVTWAPNPRPIRLPVPYTPEQLKNYLAGLPINPVTPAAATTAKPAAAAPAAGAPAAAAQPARAARAPRSLGNIYALCDVNLDYAAHVFKAYPKAKVYQDWRQMLEKEKSIDAITIGTPDHNHAMIAAHFIREKKHVYVEKPMCKTIKECRTLAQLAKEYDVVTQSGNQGHASEGTRQTVEWIQSGVVGFVREINLWTDRPSGWWPQGNMLRPPALPIPKTLNWDVWLGPAPNQPYNPACTDFQWRGLWDYGTGAMGDMGAHIFDAPMWALNLGDVKNIKIQATSSQYSTDYMPLVETITYQFPARGNAPPVKITWCDGGLKATRPDVLEPGRAVAAAVYYGDKGIMMHGSHGAVPQLVPADPNFKAPVPWIPRTGDNMEDFVTAIKNGKKSANDFSWAAKVCEVMLLTNIAVKSQKSNTILDYDVTNMKITNLPEADSLFHYEYRTGWTL
jgi:predicted dehydrogenase